MAEDHRERLHELYAQLASQRYGASRKRRALHDRAREQFDTNVQATEKIREAAERGGLDWHTQRMLKTSIREQQRLGEILHGDD